MEHEGNRKIKGKKECLKWNIEVIWHVWLEGIYSEMK